MLATGGGDAVVNLWFDCTAADKEEAFRKEVSQIYPLFWCPQSVGKFHCSLILNTCFTT